MAFKEHAGKNNGHTTYRHFELASLGNDTTMPFSADIEAAIYTNAYTSTDITAPHYASLCIVINHHKLNDLERMEYELSSRHGILNTDWNIPNWIYKADTIEVGY